MLSISPQYDLLDLPQYHLPELRGRLGEQGRQAQKLGKIAIYGSTLVKLLCWLAASAVRLLYLYLSYMLIPLVQVAQTLAELHEFFVWRCREEFERQPLAFYDD